MEREETVLMQVRRALREVFTRMSLFWRYFFLLAAVVLVFFAAHLVSTQQFSRALRQSYMEQARDNFEQRCELFSGQLFLTHSLPVSMENDAYYDTVSDPAKVADPGYMFHMVELGDSFMRQCLLMDLPGEGFLYLRQSGGCITRHRLFAQAETCFNSYIIFEDPDMDVFAEMDSEAGLRALRLLPATNVSVGGKAAEPQLFLVVQATGKEAVYGFLYPVEYVREHFQIDQMPEDTYFNLIHKDGTVIWSTGEEDTDGARFAQISVELPALSCTATLGIPNVYFEQTVQRAQFVARVFFAVSVLIGIALCVAFSHLSVKPFRRLIRAHDIERTQDMPENELVAIERFLQTARERNTTLRSMLLSSMLVRAFSGLAISEDEYHKLSAAFPLFKQPLRAAVVRDRSSNYTIDDHSVMVNRLQDVMPEQFLCEYINMQESIILLPADTEAFEQLRRVLLELNEDAERELRFVCGVSLPFLGLDEVSTAIRQAQFCIPEDGEQMLMQVVEDGAPEQGDTLQEELKQFQQALTVWNQNELTARLERMAALVGKGSSGPPEELFYNVLYLLRDTAYSSRLPFDAYEGMSYQHNGSPASNLRRLRAVISDLFQSRAAAQLTDKQMMCTEIVRFVDENFSDPNLCMASVSKRFCVSERFVYSAVMEGTGMNMSSYLARIRMHEAARLLRETQENVSAIAGKCGYPVESTFYRNFKKYYQMTPAEYKSSLSHVGGDEKGS